MFMRKFGVASVIALGAGVAWIAGANPLDNQPEASAYLSMSFGGKTQAVQPLHYGLRLDHDRRYLGSTLPAIAKADFSAGALNSLGINGVNLIDSRMQLNQFGVDLEYSWLDWGLVVAGVVGLGFIASEAIDGEEDPDPAAVEPDGGDAGGDAGGLPGGLPDLPGGIPTLPGGIPTLPGGIPSIPLGYSSYNLGLGETDKERQLWLDGGTGQMGDLYQQ